MGGVRTPFLCKLGHLSLFACALVFGAPLHADPIACKYYEAREEGGKRTFQGWDAKIYVTPGSSHADVAFVRKFPDGHPKPDVRQVPIEEVEQAVEWMKQRRISVLRSSGGRSNAIAREIIVLTEKGRSRVGLRYAFSDLIPQEELERQTNALSAFAPLADIGHTRRIAPLEASLARQHFLLGDASRESSAVPVLVLESRLVGGGALAFMVMERRALLDPAIKIANIYLVPATSLRLPKSPAEFAELVQRVEKKEHARAYRRFRQQSLAPWTHRFIHFPENEPEADEEYPEERFRRRGQFLVDILQEEKADKGKAPCANFLYENGR